MTWTVDGLDLPVDRSLQLTASSLQLQGTIPDSEIDSWDTLGARAGDTQQVQGSGGSFRVFSRGGDSAITVVPDSTYTPPFAESEWFLTGYDATQVSNTHYEVSVELSRPSNREDEYKFTDQELASVSDGFGLNFGENFGAGATTQGATIQFADDNSGILYQKNQISLQSTSGTPADAEESLTLNLSNEQAAKWIDTVGYPNAVVTRSVPDADSFAVDTSPDRQTISIESQPTVSLEDGTYLVQDWTLSFQGYSKPRIWGLDLTLQQT